MNVIDRRLNPRDKNLNNRQRFIARAREQVKRAITEAIDGSDIKDIEGGKIKVPVKGTREPIFGNDTKSGHRNYVVPGNRQYIEGDTIEKPESDGQGGGTQGSPDGQGEDDFEFTLTKDEFLNFFFEDLELPDLVKKQIQDTKKAAPKRAGYTNVGSPVQIDIRLTMRNAIGRRIALNRPDEADIVKLEQRLALLEDAAVIYRGGRLTPWERIEPATVDTQIEELRLELDVAKRRNKSIPWIDPFDVRYRNYVLQPQPASRAVMFALMDVSGSMGEREKDIAKRFFLLLYMFLTRKYENVDIVFVRHHSDAEECNEHDFFFKRESGGTVVSSGLILVNDIIRKRYPVSDWNIYVAQASDGDNYSGDNIDVHGEMDTLMPLVQYFAYLDIPNDTAGLFERTFRTSDLWKLYQDIAKHYGHLAMRQASDQGQIWGVFKELFSKDRQRIAA